MLGDIITPSIATWSAHHLYSDIDSIAVSGDIDVMAALHTYTYGENATATLLLDANETSAYQLLLHERDNATHNDSLRNLGLNFQGNDAARAGHGSGSGGGGGGGGGTGGLEGGYAIEPLVACIKMIAMSIVLGLMIFITIIGNVFVIAAIILERNLQNVANYLVVSLAVADLLVACLVMPLGAVYEISEGWILGPELCDIWTSCDVLCCTASILHLVAIAADRYWTVTNIDYGNIRTPGRVFFMIFCVWFTALIISLAPQFGWKDPEYMQRIEEQKCMVSQDLGYQIFATCCTFYVPLLAILALYWKIYKIARKRIQRRNQRPLSLAVNHNQSTSLQRKRKRLKICFGKLDQSAPNVNANANANIDANTNSNTNTTLNTLSISNMREETEYSTSNFDSKSHGTEVTTVSGDAEEPSTTSAIAEIDTVSREVATAAQQQHVIAITLTTTHLNDFAASACSQVTPTPQSNKLLSSIPNPYHKLIKRRQMLEAKRERKAAQTLAIITGAFAVCWLPFFVMALLLPLCKSCHIDPLLASLFLWLGYFNSTLNPIIYTIFNPEFRRAFQRILFGRRRTPHNRSGKM